MLDSPASDGNEWPLMGNSKKSINSITHDTGSGVWLPEQKRVGFVRGKARVDVSFLSDSIDDVY